MHDSEESTPCRRIRVDCDTRITKMSYGKPITTLPALLLLLSTTYIHAQAPSPGYDLGYFPLKRVVDGDTIEVDYLGSIRMLCVDTEEKFTDAEEEVEAHLDFPDWVRRHDRGRGNPLKYPTPFGMETIDFAKRCFDGVDKVRLEYDSPNRTRGYYWRTLAYVFYEKGGREINYNLELVRQGYSAYFTKYGYSERFHDEFLAAEREAKAAKRGIWSEGGMHYPDYEKRIPWWNRRANAIRNFDREYRDRENYFMLGEPYGLARMDGLVGQEVVVFGIWDGFSGITTDGRTARLSHMVDNDFTVVIPQGVEVAATEGEYAYFRGTLKSGDRGAFLVVEKAAEVWDE